jgi:hypothetical protein
MANVKYCDICKQQCEKIVGKLFYGPSLKSAPSKSIHSNYTHHCDVGDCCAPKLLRSFNFRQRMTAKQYAASRKNGR